MMKLGVCYYPEHWPSSIWEADAAEMKSLGLSLVRIGEFAWSKLEPKEGEFNFEWLDQVVDILGDAGLKVILGTPSATPPRWVLDKFPDLLAWDEHGQPRGFGSRRHYCFSHDAYKHFAAVMAERIAKRYGNHPALYAWQTDNEYGCHDTIRSYSPLAKKAFQVWLREKYKSIAELNARWGNVFWSMEYNSFEQIDLPNLTVTEANPSHKMDFYRFSSDQVVAWNDAQLASIRAHSDKPIFHNYMGRITEFDHFKLGREMEIATWDTYPLGFLEDRSDRSEEFKHKYQATGDPDFQAFHHDIYRAVGHGRWGIMEQQPGPVNWAPNNPAPAPGMVRVWTLEAMAHGAEFVAYFRWRQLPFGQEQMHTALKRPDNRPSTVLNEIKLINEELQKFGDTQKPKPQVGLIFDYESQWAWEVQPQGEDFDYFRLVYDFYCGLRKLGIDVDIIPPDRKSLDDYAFILVPGLFSLNDGLLNSLANYNGELLLGPRTHSKTEDFHINSDIVSELMDTNIKLDYVETIRASETREFESIGTFHRWVEQLLVDDVAVKPLIFKDKKTYLGGWPDESTIVSILTDCLLRAGIKPQLQDEGVRLQNGYLIDYGNASFESID